MYVQCAHCHVEPMGGKGWALAPTNELLLPAADKWSGTDGGATNELK